MQRLTIFTRALSTAKNERMSISELRRSLQFADTISSTSKSSLLYATLKTGEHLAKNGILKTTNTFIQHTIDQNKIDKTIELADKLIKK